MEMCSPLLFSHRIPLAVFISLALSLTVACAKKPAGSHEYTLQGQVLSLTGDHKEAMIKHDEIKGFMPAMTMPYQVKDAKLFEGIAPGDLINGKLVVEPNDAYLIAVKKVGNAPLEQAPPEVPNA